jgi:hypothetical protein
MMDVPCHLQHDETLRQARERFKRSARTERRTLAGRDLRDAMTRRLQAENRHASEQAQPER